MRQIFEDRFLFEEGAYRAYVTDEKRNMDQKDAQSVCPPMNSRMMDVGGIMAISSGLRATM